MSEDRICTITIDAKGKGMTVDLAGYHGQGCSAITEALDALGSRTVDQDKPEFFESHNQNRVHTAS